MKRFVWGSGATKSECPRAPLELDHFYIMGLPSSAGYSRNGGGRPPTEATVRTLSVLGHGRNGGDVTVVRWPGLPDVM